MTRAGEPAAPPNPVVRWGLVAVFSFVILLWVVDSWHWPVVYDAQVMHYVSFLMDHGWAPYRQIGDFNMPGAYLFEHFALHTFGNLDTGWRLWDFTLCAAFTAGVFAITRTYDWLAGVLAAGIFVMTHAGEGPPNAGQREQVMAVLLVVGTALLFEGVRRRKPSLLLLFGLSTGMAAAVKPTVVVFCPLALLIAAVHLRRSGIRQRAYVLYALAGLTCAGAIALGFLLHYQALGTFTRLLTHAMPHYASVNRLSWGRLLYFMLQLSLLFYAGCATLAYALNCERNFNWEQAVLLLGAVLGGLSYLAQHKGFMQHRYPLTAFLLILASIQIVMAMRSSQRPARWAAYAGVLAIVLFYVPRNVRWIRAQLPYDSVSMYMERDLSAMGVDRLQHQVQCLDIVDGCLNALFHLGLVQNTGSTGDLLLFLPQDAPEVQKARREFRGFVTASPPAVYVLVNSQFGTDLRSFGKLDAWPGFAEYLASEYVMVQQWDFPRGQKPVADPGGNPDVVAYRLYVRRGSSLLAQALGTQSVAQELR